MMEFSTAAQVAFYILLFFVAFLSLLTVALLFGFVIGLNKLNAKLDLVVTEVKPLISKSTDVLDTVQRVTMNVGDRADTILVRGEEITENLAKRVDQTASVVEKTVTGPLIGVSSVLSGLTKGFQVFNRGFNGNNGTNGSNHSNGTGTNNNI